MNMSTPIMNLKLPSVKVMVDAVLEGSKVENNVDLSVMWVKAPESMTHEDEVEMARQEIPGCTGVATFDVMVDCIIFSRVSYLAGLRSSGPSAVIQLVKIAYWACEDDRIPGDMVLSSIYANKEFEAHAGLPWSFQQWSIVWLVLSQWVHPRKPHTPRW